MCGCLNAGYSGSIEYVAIYVDGKWHPQTAYPDAICNI